MMPKAPKSSTEFTIVPALVAILILILAALLTTTLIQQYAFAAADDTIVAQPTGTAIDASSDTTEIIKQALSAAASKSWWLLIALVLMLVTRAIDKLFLNKVPSAMLPWLAVGLSIATQIAASLASNKDVLSSIVDGILIGLTAAGGYSALGKYLPFMKKSAEGKG